MIDITGEGEPVQSELVVREPVPTVYGDGWMVEGVVDGKVHPAVDVDHTRNDGKIVRVVQARYACSPEVAVETMRAIARAAGRDPDDPAG